MVFTPPVISLRALFCFVSRAFRVELLAVISTSLPYFMTGLMYVLYVVFIVSCVFPHVAPASRFMSQSLICFVYCVFYMTLPGKLVVHVYAYVFCALAFW